MTVLLYAAPDDPEGLRLRRFLGQSLPKASVESFSILAALVLRYQQSRGDRFLTVIVAQDRALLEEIGRLMSALDGSHVILVLPDEDEDTMRAAHRLHPRYIARRSEDYADLLAVIRRKVFPESSRGK